MTHSMLSTRARPCLPLHRVDTSQLPDGRAAMVQGNTDYPYSMQNGRELPIDFDGPEPLQMAQAAAGYVAVLMAVIALVAFAVGYFSN